MATGQVPEALEPRGEALAIEAVLASALGDFNAWLSETAWKAKENDCVNHFAHAFLAKCVALGTVLYDIAQVGIEVGVPQPKGLGIKPAVRKDLVIWGAPGMTTWDSQYRACHTPIAIIEWKARKPQLSERDLNWLAGFTKHFPSCFGAAVTVDFSGSQSRIYAAAVRAGVVDRTWLASSRQPSEGSAD
jgi:hypothetical protein